jgi:hypothetical protein
MASNQGDVRPFPMAVWVWPLPKLPPATYLYGQTRAVPLSSTTYIFGQNVIEHNPAPSPSGHPLLIR